jgi:hypothetical protein
MDDRQLPMWSPSGRAASDVTAEAQKLHRRRLDSLARMADASSFAELLERLEPPALSCGAPLETSEKRRAARELADAYDLAQSQRGDSRRAVRLPQHF